jgi:hypothetical protein
MVIVLAALSVGLSASVGAAINSPRDMRTGIRTVLVLGTHEAMSGSQQASAKRVLLKRLGALGLTGASVRTHPRELVISVAGALTSTQRGDLSVTGSVLARPVACFAGLARAPASKSSPPLVCGSKYLLTRKNLDAQPAPNNPSGYTSRTVPADPAFDHRLSVTPDAEVLGATELLSSIPGAMHSRFLCRPGVELSGTVTSSSVQKPQVGGGWAIYANFTRREAARWDALTKKTFHEYLAFEFDGRVIAAYLIEPTQDKWSSFEGSLAFNTANRGRAELISFVLKEGSLPVPDSVLKVTVS